MSADGIAAPGTPDGPAASSGESRNGSAEPIVVCDHVSRSFGRGSRAVIALYRVSCTVPARTRIAVVGRSGSGKSTLLHILAGLEAPSAGRVTWSTRAGSRLDNPSAGVPGRPSGVSVVFQSASLVPALTAVENVELALLLRAAPPAKDRARESALTALSRVGIDHLAHRLPDQLSGGQAQRVAVARTIAADPLLILADEPTGRLDAVTGRAVMAALETAAAHCGATLVVATHDMRVADRMTHRWRMRNGRLGTHGEHDAEPSGSTSVPTDGARRDGRRRPR